MLTMLWILSIVVDRSVAWCWMAGEEVCVAQKVCRRLVARLRASSSKRWGSGVYHGSGLSAVESG